MNTQQGGPPALPPALSRDSGNTLSLLFIGAAVGATLAFVFITLVLVVVLWRGGFFGPRNLASPNVDPPVRVERREFEPPRAGRDFDVMVNVRPERREPVAVAPASRATPPVFHIRSKSLNLLDGKAPTLETAGEVQSGEGYLVVRDSEDLRITGAFTVSAWFQARTTDRGMTIASRALNGPPWTFPFSSWLLRVNSAALLEGSLSDGRNYSPSTWAVSLQPGQWYHAVLTYDGDAKKMFLNGERQQRLASGMPNNPNGIGNTPGRSIIIGADESESPAAEIFDGAIDDVRIFNRALPEEEIQSVFSAGAGKYGVNR